VQVGSEGDSHGRPGGDGSPFEMYHTHRGGRGEICFHGQGGRKVLERESTMTTCQGKLRRRLSFITRSNTQLKNGQGRRKKWSNAAEVEKRRVSRALPQKNDKTESWEPDRLIDLSKND